MKRILQKLLPAPLAIINWTMFLVSLGWAITFFVGETIEGCEHFLGLMKAVADDGYHKWHKSVTY